MTLAKMANAIVKANYTTIRELVKEDGRGFLTNAYVQDQIYYNDIANDLENWQSNEFFVIADDYTFFNYAITDNYVLPEYLQDDEAAQSKLKQILEEVNKGDE